VQNRPINIALVQMSCTEPKRPNVDKALARIAEAADRGANVVCLQELCTGPYFCQTEDHRWFADAESIPGPTSEALAAAAQKHGVGVIGSLSERRSVGREGALQFWGGSFVSDPNGNLLAKASHDNEEILLAQCDLGLIDVVRTHWPFLRDRRIDAYGDITKRYLL